MTVLLFVVALLIIVAASELFTNAVEWAGFRLKLGSGATGSLLAALGTALPETVVPIVALTTGAPGASQVAMGAVLGAPLLLLTLGSAVTGVAVMMRRRAPVLTIPAAQARRDLGTFVCAFALVLVAMALPQAAHYVIGAVLLLIYGAYVIATLRGGSAEESMPEPLHLMRWHRTRDSHDVAVGLQLLAAVGGLIVGSEVFVNALNSTATTLHFNPLILALVLVPFATELPETLNSVLWVRSDDDGLAFGNVAGSATFQACILGFVGLMFTSWQPGGNGLLSAGFTLVTAVVLLVGLRHGQLRGRWLALAALPWIAYVVIAVASGGQIGAAAN